MKKTRFLVQFSLILALIGIAGPQSGKFSVEFNHGGYFVREGSKRSYVNGHVLWYDQVDQLTWSPIMLENLVEEIGWEMVGRLKVFYCIPFLSVSRNGLREIRSEADTEEMLQFLSIGHHYFSLYLDHEDSLKGTMDFDDDSDDDGHTVHEPIVRRAPSTRAETVQSSDCNR